MSQRQLQTSFSAGELGPDFAGREDLKAYYAGASSLLNMQLDVPGLAYRSHGLRFRARHRHVLAAVALGGAVKTAPRGGVAANATDGDEATVLLTVDALNTANPYVVLQLDFGAPVAVDFVDVVDIMLTTGAIDDEFFVQSSTDNAIWTNFGPAFNLESKARTRRRWSAAQVSARYWRVAHIGVTASVEKVSLAEVRFWSETAALSGAKELRFAFSAATRYVFIASDRNIAVWDRVDGLVGNITIPHTSAQIGAMTWTQSLDTALLFHKDVPVWRLFRQGSADEWDSRAQSFDNIPQYDFGNSPGGVDAVQRVTARGNPADGDSYKFNLEDEISDSYETTGVAATYATRIQTVLRRLKNTSPNGITVAYVGGSAPPAFDVTFGGTEGKRPWKEMTSIANSPTSYVTVQQTTAGKKPGENVFSATRGYPRCGVFYQGRLYLGGIGELTDAYIGSVSAEFFNLDDRTDRDDRGFLRRLQSDQSATIKQMFAAGSLLAFTDTGEWFMRDEPATPKGVTFKIVSEYGVAENVPVVLCDGAPVFVAGAGATVCEVGVREVPTQDAKFAASELSSLASHLIKAPIDAAARGPIAEGRLHSYVIVNSDGTLAMLNSMRTQNLTGWAPRSTQGKFLAARDDFRGDFWFVVERTFLGVSERYIESTEAGLQTDCASTIAIVAEQTISGGEVSVFGYVFANPASADLVGVRVDGVRLTYAEEYSVNLGAKTITLVTPAHAGQVVRVAQMVANLTGYSRFDNGKVWLTVDGTPEAAEKPVAGGAVALDKPADTSIEIGLSFVSECSPMEATSPLPDGTSMNRIKRICAATVRLKDTPYFEISANASAFRGVPLHRNALDLPVREAGFSGPVRVDNLLGYTREGQLRLRQTKPLPFAVSNVLMELAF